MNAMANDETGARFLVHFADSVCKERLREEVWHEAMRLAGHALTHPDDGWVDRENNTVRFCYPKVFRRPKVGDTVALGWYDKWRVVRLVKFEPGFFDEENGLWWFEEEPK